MILRSAIEASFFVAVAALLHVIWFLLPEDPGMSAGGAGGTSSVTFAGASAEMVELVEEWDVSPGAQAEPDAMEVAELSKQQDLDATPEATTDVRMDPSVTAAPIQLPQTPLINERTPETATITPAPTASAPLAMDAPQLDTAAFAPTIMRPVQAPPSLTAPESPSAPPPPPVEAAPPEEPEPVEEPIKEETETSEVAPASAPTPKKRPKQPVKRADAPKPAPAAKQAEKPAPKKPEPVAAQASSGTEEVQTSRAAGTGGASEAGSGQSALNAGGGADQMSLVQAWGSQIRREVERKKPRNTRRTGTVQIAMTIGRDGGLMGAEVRASSGSGRLDKAALKAVRAAAPYAPAPPELTGGSFEFVLPIAFRR
ncbi:MAG: TonB family protein [Pseudomonadota bacterium]